MNDISIHDIHEGQPIIALYTPPTDLTPGEVGLLYDNKFEDREITATIIDLAMRGFVAIRKVPRSHVLGNYTVYEFELLRDDAGVLDLKRHEQAVLNGLFGVVGSVQMDKMQAGVTNPKTREKIAGYYTGTEQVSMIGNRVCIDELRPYFYQYVSQAYMAAHAQLQRSDYLKHGSPLMAWSVLIVGAGLLASAPVFARRAVLGNKARRYLDGFILYLNTAEVDRLGHTQAPQTVEQKEEGVKLYKTYLPYAIALGLESEWSQQFQSAYTESPMWISGETDISVLALQSSVAVALQQARL